MSNTTLRYGFEWDHDYFINISMFHQSYTPIISLVTIHPVMQYLLIFENKSMKRDIRILYTLTHLALILNEWTFSFALRIYPVHPFAALYCEGPLCRAGIEKRILMVLLSIPVILITAPFIPLSMRMHQMFVSPETRLSTRTQVILAVLLNLILVSNVVGFGVFGKDHDDAEHIMQRFTSTFTQTMSRRMFHIFLIQCMGALNCYIVPLVGLFSCILLDSTAIHGWICSPVRFTLLTLFTVNGHQFCIFFIVKNPTYRKLLTRKMARFVLNALNIKRRNSVTPTPNNISITSR